MLQPSHISTIIAPFLLATAGLMASSGQLLADSSMAEIARKVHSDNKAAIVTLSAVADIQINIPGRGNQAQEHKIEITGTVISEQGLTVVPNTSIDLARTMKSSLPAGLRRMNVDVKADVKDVNFIFRDGTELSAKIVLKDSKLDLAFVLPDPKDVEEEGITFHPVKITADVKEVQLFDDLITLSRMSRDFDREIAVYPTKVEAVLHKPRHMIVTHNNSSGTPAFDLEGNVVGFFVKKVVGRRVVGSILLPVSEALETIEEARNAKPDDAEQADTEDGEKKEAENNEETAAE